MNAIYAKTNLSGSIALLFAVVIFAVFFFVLSCDSTPTAAPLPSLSSFKNDAGQLVVFAPYGRVFETMEAHKEMRIHSVVSVPFVKTGSTEMWYIVIFDPEKR